MTSGLAGPLLTDMVIKRGRNLLSPFYDLYIRVKKKILLSEEDTIAGVVYRKTNQLKIKIK